MRPARRPGLTLLEVLIALAVLLLSFAGLAALVTLGGNLALVGQMRTQAAQLCQSKLAEVAAGVLPLSSADGSFDEAPDYHWSVTAEQGAAQGLWNVTVRVTRERDGGGRIEVALSQMLLDPATVGSTQDVPASSTTTGTDPTGGGSSSGSGAAAAAPAAAAPAPAPAPAPAKSASPPAKSSTSGK